MLKPRQEYPKILISWDSMFSLPYASLQKRLKDEKVQDSDHLTFIQTVPDLHSIVVSRDPMTKEEAMQFFNENIRNILASKRSDHAN